MIPFISHSSNDKIKEIKNRLVIVRISRWSGDRKEVGVTIKKQHKRLVKCSLSRLYPCQYRGCDMVLEFLKMGKWVQGIQNLYYFLQL